VYLAIDVCVEVCVCMSYIHMSYIHIPLHTLKYIHIPPRTHPLMCVWMYVHVCVDLTTSLSVFLISVCLFVCLPSFIRWRENDFYRISSLLQGSFAKETYNFNGKKERNTLSPALVLSEYVIESINLCIHACIHHGIYVYTFLCVYTCMHTCIRFTTCLQMHIDTQVYV